MINANAIPKFQSRKPFVPVFTAGAGAPFGFVTALFSAPL
jgi:hypothetical protein